MNIASQIIDLAKQSGAMITTAESCTGGMIVVALTDVAGSSAVVDRSFVTYSNAAKVEMLGVRPETLDAHGAVSEEVAREMAEGALLRSRAQLAVSITGIAGPGGSEHKPEGRVCFGLAMRGVSTRSETHDFGAQGRAEVRRLSRDHALALLRAALTDQAPQP